MNLPELSKQARTMGEDHGYTHANFCDAYGWADNEASIPLKHGSARGLLAYLLAGESLETTAAQHDITALDLLGEYIAGFIDGIEAFEEEHYDI